MCGIAGFIQWSSRSSPDALRENGLAMARVMSHRGPDDEGVWVDAEAGICLVHRRLSIIDLSSEGRQPMTSACGRYVIVFNGEIYNHASLRKSLTAAGHSFRGGSDTEVMLVAIAAWGLRRALESFVGMFSFALWDDERREVTLARDRMGEKPLYYGISGHTFLFASEIKSIRAHPDWRGKVSRTALAVLMRKGYIPAPLSIYEEVRKLFPGTFLVVKLSDGKGDAQSLPSPQEYWSVRVAAEAGQRDPFKGDEKEAVDRLEGLLTASIRDQMVADVPVGAFLSGGIDSSLVVAIMQRLSREPVRTFTIGFNERGYDEAGFARKVAEHIGTHHTELYVSAEEARAVIPMLPVLYDEPFADFSQIPTFLVSRMAKRDVTVSLSGDGGDELFFGYNRYLKAQWLHEKLRLMPKSVRRTLAATVRAIPQELFEWRGFRSMLPAVLAKGHRGQVANLAEKVASALDADGPGKLYSRLTTHWSDRESVLQGVQEAPCAGESPDYWAQWGLTAGMMLMDQLSYLPDDILVKVDRASMGVSLESRIPMLDHRIVEFAWSLPMTLKLRDGKPKWPLLELLGKYVPRTLFERPKMGFSVPIGAWLRGELRDWAEDLLDAGRLSREGYLEPAPIRKKWKEHLAGDRNWQYHLWNVIVFQAWLQRQSEGSGGGG
jgi:asparagine synthase (glutamine-hydrolysing)